MSPTNYKVQISYDRENWPFCWFAQVNVGTLCLGFSSRATRKGAIKAAQRAVKNHMARTTEVIELESD